MTEPHTESRMNPDDALTRPEGGGVQMTEYPTTQTPETDALFLADRKNAFLEAEVEQLTGLLSEAAVRAAEWEEAAKGYKASILHKNQEIKAHWAAWSLLAHDPDVSESWRRIAARQAGITQ
jgi:hypothetical protein